jgi:hypothetical protein
VRRGTNEDEDKEASEIGACGSVFMDEWMEESFVGIATVV